MDAASPFRGPNAAPVQTSGANTVALGGVLVPELVVEGLLVAV